MCRRSERDIGRDGMRGRESTAFDSERAQHLILPTHPSLLLISTFLHPKTQCIVIAVLEAGL